MLSSPYQKLAFTFETTKGFLREAAVKIALLCNYALLFVDDDGWLAGRPLCGIAIIKVNSY